MYEGINIVAVVGTTFFMMASATVWFSPLMFGKAWLRQLRATEAEIEASRQNVVLHLGLTALCHVTALSVLALVAARSEALGLSYVEVSAALTLFVVGLLGHSSLWENKSRTYFLITAGFYAYFIVIGLIMLTHWPW